MRFQNKLRNGLVDPISLIGIGFLVVTLIVGVSVTNNPLKRFLITSQAGFSPDSDVARAERQALRNGGDEWEDSNTGTTCVGAACLAIQHPEYQIQDDKGNLIMTTQSKIIIETQLKQEAEKINQNLTLNQITGNTTTSNPFTITTVTPATTTTQVGQPCTNCHLSPTQQTQNSVQLPSQQTLTQVINLMNKDNPVPPTTHYAVIDNKLVTGTVETNKPLRISLQSISDLGNAPFQPSADSVNKAKSLLDFITYNLNPDDNSVYTKIATETLLDDTKTTNFLGQPSTIVQDAMNNEQLQRTRNAGLTGLALSISVLTGGTLIPFVADVGLPTAALMATNTLSAATPAISALTVGGLTVGAVECGWNFAGENLCKTATDMAVIGYTGNAQAFGQMFNDTQNLILKTANTAAYQAGLLYKTPVITDKPPIQLNGYDSFIDDYGNEIFIPSNSIIKTITNVQPAITTNSINTSELALNYAGNNITTNPLLYSLAGLNTSSVSIPSTAQSPSSDLTNAFTQDLLSDPSPIGVILRNFSEATGINLSFPFTNPSKVTTPVNSTLDRVTNAIADQNLSPIQRFNEIINDPQANPALPFNTPQYNIRPVTPRTQLSAGDDILVGPSKNNVDFPIDSWPTERNNLLLTPNIDNNTLIVGVNNPTTGSKLASVLNPGDQVGVNTNGDLVMVKNAEGQMIKPIFAFDGFDESGIPIITALGNPVTTTALSFANQIEIIGVEAWSGVTKTWDSLISKIGGKSSNNNVTRDLALEQARDRAALRYAKNISGEDIPLNVAQILYNGEGYKWENLMGSLENRAVSTTINTKDIYSIDSDNFPWNGDQGHISVQEARDLFKSGNFDPVRSNKDPIMGYQLINGKVHIIAGRHRATAALLEEESEIPIELYKIKNQEDTISNPLEKIVTHRSGDKLVIQNSDGSKINIVDYTDGSFKPVNEAELKDGLVINLYKYENEFPATYIITQDNYGRFHITAQLLQDSYKSIPLYDETITDKIFRNQNEEQSLQETINFFTSNPDIDKSPIEIVRMLIKNNYPDSKINTDLVFDTLKTIGNAQISKLDNIYKRHNSYNDAAEPVVSFNSNYNKQSVFTAFAIPVVGIGIGIATVDYALDRMGIDEKIINTINDLFDLVTSPSVDTLNNFGKSVSGWKDDAILETIPVPPTEIISEPDSIMSGATTTDIPVKPTETLFEGAAVYTEYKADDTRGVIYHVIRIDLDHANFFVGPQQSKMAPSNFLAEYDQDIAINGDGWHTYTDDDGKVRMPTSGLAISDGFTYWDYGKDNPQAIFFDKDNNISFFTPDNPNEDKINSSFNAISYQNLLVNHGQKYISGGDPTRVTPRTVLGVTDNNNDGVYDELILIVVDGNQDRTGMNLDELSDILIEQGAVIGVNMDGGTSSTMVLRDENGGEPIIYDNDPGSTNKSVANHLGITITP